MNAKQLESLIRKSVRSVVREEVRRAVNEVLGESLMRRVVSEQISKMRLSEDYTDVAYEHDRVPEPLENDDEGVYATNPLTQNESTSRLLSGDNPLAALYEGVVPASAREGMTPRKYDFDIPAPAEPAGDGGGSASRYAEVFRRAQESAAATREERNLEAEMQRIRLQREELDRRVV